MALTHSCELRSWKRQVKKFRADGWSVEIHSTYIDVSKDGDIIFRVQGIGMDEVLSRKMRDLSIEDYVLVRYANPVSKVRKVCVP